VVGFIWRRGKLGAMSHGMRGRGPTLHRCCGVALPAGARRKRDVAACDTARDQRTRRRVLLGWRRCSGFHGATLTTVLTAVGAQTANRSNDFSQLSLAGRSIQVPPASKIITYLLNTCQKLARLFARATPVPAGNAGLVRLQCAVGQGGGNDRPGG
jgi:hypothetical protein